MADNTRSMAYHPAWNVTYKSMVVLITIYTGDRLVYSLGKW